MLPAWWSAINRAHQMLQGNRMQQSLCAPAAPPVRVQYVSAAVEPVAALLLMLLPLLLCCVGGAAVMGVVPQ
jgi:hypothetical protein